MADEPNFTDVVRDPTFYQLDPSQRFALLRKLSPDGFGLLAPERQAEYMLSIEQRYSPRANAPSISADQQVMPVGPLAGITKSQFRRITATLPWVGGAAGGIIGAPGVATSVAGAALGGGAGTALEKILNLAFVDKPETQTSEGNAVEIAKSAATQGALQGGAEAAAPLLKAASPVLMESAEKSMSQALGATKQGMKAQAEKVVPGLVERRVTAVTRQGLLEKAETGLSDARQGLNVALEKVPNDLTPDKKAAISELEDLKGRFLQRRDVTGTPEFARFDEANKALVNARQSGAYPSEISQLVGERDAAEKALMNLPLAQVKPSAIEAVNGMQNLIRESDPSYFSLRQLKTKLDGLVDRKSGYLVTDADYTNREITRGAADALRRVLVDAAQGNGAQAVTQANKEFSFWMGARNVLAETISRTKPQVGGLRGTISAAAGAAGSLAGGGTIGGAAAWASALKLTQALIDSTAWKTISASAKSSLADVLAKGDAPRAISLITRLSGGTIAAATTNENGGQQ